MINLPYEEGTIFSVPLRTGGYARGVVARANNEGKVLLGYFFGPQFTSANNMPIEDINPANSILCVRFGDLGLINGKWKILGKIPNWNRTQWPMPNFIRHDPLSNRSWLVQYSDNDPNFVEKESPVSNDCSLPHDLLSGYGAVEIKLTKLLS